MKIQGKTALITGASKGIGKATAQTLVHNKCNVIVNYATDEKSAKNLAPKIIVNSIAPGKTLTPLWGEMDEEYKRNEAKDHLINRWILPEEIADGVLFLLKNDAVCGEILTIDGGMSLKTLG